MMAAAVKSELSGIQSLCALFLQETNFQIQFDACHERGWQTPTRSWSTLSKSGTAQSWGRKIKDRDTVFEYFVVPCFRKHTNELFRRLLSVSGARHIECQSNDLLLSSMLYEFSPSVHADVVLFKDHAVAGHMIPGAVVRRWRGEDEVFEHGVEPLREYVVELTRRDHCDRRIPAPLQPAVRGLVHGGSDG
jgi:hypothetical protein